MAELSRRKLLTTAGGALGAAAAATLLPPNLRRAMAQAPAGPRSIDDVEHVVILMQENRSFDHYFGTLKGVRGFDDPNMAKLPNGKPLIYQPDTDNPAGYLLPYHLDSNKTNAQAMPSTSHAWEVQHSAWNKGKMDNWLPAHRKADGDSKGPYTMGYFTEADIPFQHALAKNFTICDGYHASVLGPTWPNRLYLWSASIDPDGKHGGPIITNQEKTPYTWTTYPERLTKAGVTWQVYQEKDNYGCNPLVHFKAFQDAKPGSDLYDRGMVFSAADKFAEDAKNGKLPTVSWIVPTKSQCEHPDALPAAGADYVADRLDAVAANVDLWNKTLFILNYDENDGLFDHVIPPTPTAGTAGEFIDGLPIGGGIRVPCIIVSPWTLGGYVATDPFDHTSVLQLLESVTGVKEENITAWRRSAFKNLTSALNTKSADPFPKLPETKEALKKAQHNAETLPPPKFPGKDQTPPHQDTVAPATTAAAAATGGRARSVSRLEESHTSHRSDFPDGFADTVFPGVLSAVAGAPFTATRAAYVCAPLADTVAVCDADRRALASGLPGGSTPYAMALAGRSLYVTNADSDTVTVLDTATGLARATVTVGRNPHGIAAHGNTVYVANTGADTARNAGRTVTAIDTATHAVTRTFDVGVAPYALAVSPDGSTLYAACHDGLSVVDTATGAAQQIPAAARAASVTVSPDGRRIYAADTWHNSVTVLDAASHAVTQRIPVGAAPWQVTLAPGGRTGYVANANSDSVTIFDTARGTVRSTLTGVGHNPTAVAADADQIWVTATQSGTVTVFDANTHRIHTSIPIGAMAAPGAVLLAKR